MEYIKKIKVFKLITHIINRKKKFEIFKLTITKNKNKM